MADSLEREVAGVDVGGTFTDVVLLGKEGRPILRKVATDPGDQAAGVVRGLGDHRPDLRLLAHGTTTATNAILERSVGRVALATTRGFRDVLFIGRQDRPSLYDLRAVRPAALVDPGHVVEVLERSTPLGDALIDLADQEIQRVVDRLASFQPEAVAISLLFSYARPSHEERLATAIEARLGVPVTRSSALLPEFREYERTSTAVLNAALTPVMGRYLQLLRKRMPEPCAIRVMTSGGGTTGIGHLAAAPVHALLSGPAAGAVAAARIARQAGFDQAVAFDMGGTSTDVCLILDGRPQVLNESEVAGLPFRTPAVALHTVGAGGGSIAWLDPGGALRVGPRSAGARPGPAAYGLGGLEPTVTDAHCVLGHLSPDRALGSDALRLNLEAARRALDALPRHSGGAEGILRVVRATMARALRRVTTERGVDPRELALVAYGGAGPLHATALAREIGFPTVIVPPAPGVLSALGLLLAPPRYETSRTVLGAGDVPGVWLRLEEEAERELRRQGAGDPVDLLRFADCRYRGQSHELRVPVTDEDRPWAAFHDAHDRAFGYRLEDEPVEVVTLRVVAEGVPTLRELPDSWDHGGADTEGRRRITLDDGRQVEARIVSRGSLPAGKGIRGPAVIEQLDATTLLLPGDVAEGTEAGSLVVHSDG